MPKKIITLLFVTLTLSACSLLPAKKLEDKVENKIKDEVQEKKNVFTSIKDAVTRQLPLKCEYTEDGHTTTTYIKGQKVRLVGNAESQGIEGLMTNDKFYLWNTADKKGMVLEMAKITGAKMGTTEIKSVDDVVGVLESKKENCTLVDKEDTIFELPTDITFTNAPDFFVEPTK
jgi:hypothetical protein